MIYEDRTRKRGNIVKATETTRALGYIGGNSRVTYWARGTTMMTEQTMEKSSNPTARVETMKMEKACYLDICYGYNL